MTGTVTQHALFAAPPSSAATSGKPLPEKPSSETQTSEKPAPVPATLTTEELIEHIFQSMCKGRRWERELLLSASDQELGRIIWNLLVLRRNNRITSRVLVFIVDCERRIMRSALTPF